MYSQIELCLQFRIQFFLLFKTQSLRTIQNNFEIYLINHIILNKLGKSSLIRLGNRSKLYNRIKGFKSKKKGAFKHMFQNFVLRNVKIQKEEEKETHNLPIYCVKLEELSK